MLKISIICWKEFFTRTETHALSKQNLQTQTLPGALLKRDGNWRWLSRFDSVKLWKSTTGFLTAFSKNQST